MMMPRDADTLRVFVPVAIRAVFARLAPRLEAAAGRMLAPASDLNPAIPKRILAGEAYDIGLTNPPTRTRWSRQAVPTARASDPSAASRSPSAVRPAWRLLS